MARANVPRRQGEDFQARLFWLYAASLLDPASPVTRVAYERGPKAFDDILIEYDAERAPLDHEGRPIHTEHIQCKWHKTAGTFGYQALIEPTFINASRFSLLQRAYRAHLDHAPAGTGFRFVLMTNWRIAPGDPLLELIEKSSDAINRERLFAGKTDRSRMGQVRKLWREHLCIDDDALRQMIRTLAIAETSESLQTLRQRLDERFAVVGLRRESSSHSGFSYDDLIAKLLAQGRVDFDRERFGEMARQEGILGEPTSMGGGLVIGVRSFAHPIDRLENRCERVLDLVPYFDGRYIRRDADWQERIVPELRAFILNAARSAERLHLVLDTHASLAYAVGVLLNVKSGKQVHIEQRTGGRRFWFMSDGQIDQDWPNFVFEDEVLSGRGEEIAIAVSLTHDVSPGATRFVHENLRRVGRIMHCRLECGPSQQSVHCGRHAWQLVESLVWQLLATRGKGYPASPVHVFVAGPNGFAFFLGQQLAIGPAHLYEWDFEGQRGGGYSLGLSVKGQPSNLP